MRHFVIFIDLQTYRFAVTDDHPVLAEREALRIAESFWPNRHRMQVRLVSLDEMATRMLQPGRGTIALVDAADATSSGASGDSIAILKKLIECGYRGTTLMPIVDAPAVMHAFAGGRRWDNSNLRRWDTRSWPFSTDRNQSHGTPLGRRPVSQ